MQNGVIWGVIFKALETSEMRRVDLIRPFFLPLKISKHPWVMIFFIIISWHSCHWFFFFLLVQFIMQDCNWTWRIDIVFTLETRLGVCQGSICFVSFLSIIGQVIWLLTITHTLDQTSDPITLSLTLANCRHLEDSVFLKPCKGDTFLVYCFSCQWIWIQGL